MNHKINTCLRTTHQWYLHDPVAIPHCGSLSYMPKIWGGLAGYWGIIKLAFPIKCRGLGFCLDHEITKYYKYNEP